MIGCLLSGPRYSGPVSDHYDGRRFRNPEDTRHRSPREVLHWLATRNPGPWPRWVENPPGPPPPKRIDRGIRVTFVNHATVLIQTDGLNLLTDPIWSERASPSRFIGPRRVRPPGIRFEDLPPIDVVVVSHNHYDHLDLPTLKRLAQAHDPLFVVGLGNAALLQKAGIARVQELDWWQSLSPDKSLTITAVPARHFSARGLCDRDATLWAGYYLNGPDGAVYFAGDTGYGVHFEQIRKRLGAPRLALLPIGAFRPRWFMARVHLSPADAIRAMKALGARHALAIHFGTFPLADDGMEEPAIRLRELLAAHPAPRPDFRILDFGAGWSLPPAKNSDAALPATARSGPSRARTGTPAPAFRPAGGIAATG